MLDTRQRLRQVDDQRHADQRGSVKTLAIGGKTLATRSLLCRSGQVAHAISTGSCSSSWQGADCDHLADEHNRSGLQLGETTQSRNGKDSGHRRTHNGRNRRVPHAPTH
jgi:hypothetical protein